MNPVAVPVLTLAMWNAGPSPVQTGTEPLPRLQSFATDAGLAHNNVPYVVQDRFGFVWVATALGVQRFDGTSFADWPDGPDADPRLRGNLSVRGIDAEDGLWLGVRGGGFMRADLATGKVVALASHERAAAAAIDPSPDGGVWLAGIGELHRVPHGGRAPVDTVPDVFPPGSFPSWMHRGPSGLWAIGVQQGEGWIVLYEPEPGVVHRLSWPAVGGPLRILEGERGRLWVAGTEGLALFEWDDGPPDRDGLGDAIWTVDLGGAQIGGLVMDHEGSLWFSTAEWVGRLRPDGETLERYGASGGTSPLFTDLLVDQRGIVWMGSLAGGLHRLDPRPRGFVHVARGADIDPGMERDFVVSLLEAPDGGVWVGTLYGGLYRLDDMEEGGRRIILPQPAPGFPSPDIIWSLHEDREGRIWVGTDRGLYLQEPESEVLEPLPATAGGQITAMADASDGGLWLADYDRGVLRVDPESGSLGPTLPWQAVTAVHVDSTGALWVGSRGWGIARMRPSDTGFAELVPAPGSHTEVHESYTFHEDGRGTLWVGTDRGLVRISADHESYETISLEGIPPTSVFSMVEDDVGRLWLGTGHGLVRYAPATGEARRFGRLHGVGGTEFNRGAGIRLASGDLLFGGVEGMTRVMPSRLDRATAPAPMALTSFAVVGRQGARGGLLRGQGELRLKWQEHAVTLEFGSLDFEDPLAHRFRYRMEGVDPDWIPTRPGDRRVTYAGLRPGTYTFRVQRVGPGTAEPPSEASIRLIKDPAVWETAWFRVLLVALVMGGVLLVYRMRVEQDLRTARLRLRVARDLHDEVGANLSAIALLSDAAAGEADVSPDTRRRLARIGASARRMVGEVRDIAWAIGPEAARPGELQVRMKDTAAELLPGVRVTFNLPLDTMPSSYPMAARRELLLAYKEALHNVARHSGARAVSVGLVRRGDEVELSVADDGSGFDPTAARSGTGLRSLRERTARLGGRLDVQSAPGEGTTIRIVAPLEAHR